MHRSRAYSSLSFLYMLILVVFVMVEEIADDTINVMRFVSLTYYCSVSLRAAPQVLHYYMYSIGIVFMLYMNVIVIRPYLYNRIVGGLSRRFSYLEVHCCLFFLTSPLGCRSSFGGQLCTTAKE